MGKEEYLWLVRCWPPWDLGDSSIEPFNGGTITVVASEQYEAIGKAMTVPGIESTVVDPASIKAERLILLHEEDQKYTIEIKLKED